ncbi:MAG: DUF2520 domain-containing protein [Prevotella sp.]|nr:DUF2520 domain-containing protein [Bacteroides sp.]MCM1366631.1 DUF2520 domain-containing protein [Prevotella sp.]MCM1436996.1 DUF2520 domain-containing protein [Prevotella sp.]
MKICIIGNGNVAWHLSKALAGKCELCQVNSRTLEGLTEDADVYIISVSDEAIPHVVSHLSNRHISGLVVHTSGSTPLSSLESFYDRCGVMYPLQTFSKGSKLNYNEIPMFIEARAEDDLPILQKVAHLISPHCYQVNSKTREKFHIAAVFSCNFVNHLFGISADILHKEGLPFDVLKPLVHQTVKKCFEISNPFLGQTGPAARHDFTTMRKHLNILQDNYTLQQIYSLLSKSIMTKEDERNKL